MEAEILSLGKNKITNEASIAFTTTAMIRPDILERTYSSFKRNLVSFKMEDCPLYLNIDRLPAGKDYQHVITVANKYFKNVVYNISQDPSLPMAINWLWTTANSDYIFHLEDDWELVRTISMREVIGKFSQKGVEMVQLKRLNKDFQGVVGLTPCVMSRKFYKGFAGKFKEYQNPEYQMQRCFYKVEGFELRDDGLSNDNVFVFQTGGFAVRDIGRDWLKKSPYKRPSHPDFVSWIKR